MLLQTCGKEVGSREAFCVVLEGGVIGTILGLLTLCTATEIELTSDTTILPMSGPWDDRNRTCCDSTASKECTCYTWYSFQREYQCLLVASTTVRTCRECLAGDPHLIHNGTANLDIVVMIIKYR